MPNQKRIRVYYTPSRKLILEGAVARFGRGGVQLIKSWITFSRAQVGKGQLLRGKLFLSPIFGIARAYSLRDSNGQQLPWRPFHIIFPNPLLFPLWGRFLLPLKSAGIALEIVDGEVPLVERALSLDEKEIFDLQRIQFLMKQLIFVEARAEGVSRLYKNSKDNTLWQYLEIPDPDGPGVGVRFTQISLPQWTYGYLEQKFLVKGEKQIEVERAFWDALEEDSYKRPCSEEGCGKTKVQYSALCKFHHFKAIFGKDPNTEGIPGPIGHI